MYTQQQEAIDISALESRITTVREFLNSELTNLKTDNGRAVLGFSQIGSHMDTLHEAERIGLRHLSYLEFAKVKRTLTSIEACIQLSNN